MTTNLNPTHPIPTNMSIPQWDALTQDPTWQSTVDELEMTAGGTFTNSFQPMGWMKTWPELPTYSHYMQLRSLVLRGFAAMLRDTCSGDIYDAASNCGKPLVFDRLFTPNDDIKATLLALVEGENLGPQVELTPERSAIIRTVLQQVLTAADWSAIAQAAAAQAERQVMKLAAA
jgi:hypothetical protein